MSHMIIFSSITLLYLRDVIFEWPHSESVCNWTEEETYFGEIDAMIVTLIMIIVTVKYWYPPSKSSYIKELASN